MNYIIAIISIVMLVAIYFTFKSINTQEMRSLIVIAISDYKRQNLDLWPHYPVEYENMESAYVTTLRFWDWGYSRILPPEKFAIVAPYIKGLYDA